MSTRVHTFYGHVPLLSIEDETRLIMLWRDAWTKAGFEPIVLNEFIASKNVLFPHLEEKIKTLPSVNPEGYESACYLRWLAMAEIGGGIMADYDVFPYGWTWIYKEFPDILLTFQGHCPSLVCGSKSAYLKVVKGFLDYQVNPLRDLHDGRPHTSDMYIMRDGNIPHKEKNVVVDFGKEGWETAKAVHYNTSTTTPKHLPRWKHIPLLRPFDL